MRQRIRHGNTYSSTTFEGIGKADIIWRSTSEQGRYNRGLQSLKGKTWARQLRHLNWPIPRQVVNPYSNLLIAEADPPIPDKLQVDSFSSLAQAPASELD